MSFSRRSLLATLAAAPFTALASRTAFAAYPDRPVRLIVPFAAGGNADLVGRLLAEGMAPSLGQSLVVENRAGAGGSLAAGVVAQSAPDGYTLLIGSNGPLTVNPFMQAKLELRPAEGFRAVGLANLAPHAIVVNPAIPAKTVAELVALSKKRHQHRHLRHRQRRPHDTGALHDRDGSDADACPVQGRLDAGARHAVRRGRRSDDRDVDRAAAPQGGQAAHPRGGVGGALAAGADVPTMNEAGVKDFLAASYVGLLAPAKTPPDVIAALQRHW